MAVAAPAGPSRCKSTALSAYVWSLLAKMGLTPEKPTI